MSFQCPLNSWYRDDSTTPLEAPVSYGGSKDLQTTSTLSVTPSRDDDGVKYKCVVWNRAMIDDQRLETIVTLSVNCKYIFIHFHDLFPIFRLKFTK
jgi:hypothetical protein